MERVIRSMVEEGVSADQFISFINDFGIQDDPFVQEVLNNLLANEACQNQVSPCPWTIDDADDLLELLKSPVRAPLNEIHTNVTSRWRQFTCKQCNKKFLHQWKLKGHIKDVHQQPTENCSKCKKTFTRQRNLRQHEKVCQGIATFPCDKCEIILKSARELEFHQKIKHKVKPQKRQQEKSENEPPAKRQRQASPQPGPSSVQGPMPGPSSVQGPSTYKCRRCPAQFSDRQALHAHQVQQHYQVGAGLHPEPFPRDQEPWVNEDGTVNEGLRDCYRTNRALILERYREGPVESLYNIPMYPGMTLFDIGQALQGIYDRQRHAFKINLSFGFIMRHVGAFDIFGPTTTLTCLTPPS